MKTGDADDEEETGAMPLSLSLSDSPMSAPPATRIDDQILLRALLEGNRAAAGALYDLLRAPIDSTLRRILHQRGPDFEDHVQVTFERILRALAEGRFEGRSSLKTWACAIASHVALDALRRKKRDSLRLHELPDQDVLPSSGHTDKRLESLSELKRVQGILADMKPQLSETLILHDVLGYKLNEIGELKNSSDSATQSRLQRARKEFRRRAERPISRRKS